MVNLSDTYILDKCINKKTGESTDREHRRKGQKIKFIGDGRKTPTPSG